MKLVRPPANMLSAAHAYQLRQRIADRLQSSFGEELEVLRVQVDSEPFHPYGPSAYEPPETRDNARRMHQAIEGRSRGFVQHPAPSSLIGETISCVVPLAMLLSQLGQPGKDSTLSPTSGSLFSVSKELTRTYTDLSIRCNDGPIKLSSQLTGSINIASDHLLWAVGTASYENVYQHLLRCGIRLPLHHLVILSTTVRPLMRSFFTVPSEVQQFANEVYDAADFSSRRPEVHSICLEDRPLKRGVVLYRCPEISTLDVALMTVEQTQPPHADAWLLAVYRRQVAFWEALTEFYRNRENSLA